MNPYGIRPRNVRINGTQAKGYFQEDLIETVRRYVPKSEARALIDELKPVAEGSAATDPANGEATNGQSPNAQPTNNQTAPEPIGSPAGPEEKR